MPPRKRPTSAPNGPTDTSKKKHTLRRVPPQSAGGTRPFFIDLYARRPAGEGALFQFIEEIGASVYCPCRKRSADAWVSAPSPYLCITKGGAHRCTPVFRTHSLHIYYIRMNRKNLFTAMMALAALPTVMAAQSAKTWTLQDCIDHALSHNITLQKNRAAETTAAIGVKEARGALMPTLSAQTSQGLTYRPFQETEGNIVNGSIASNTANKATQSGSYGINASWTVWDGGKKRYSVATSELKAQQAEAESDITAQTLQEQIANLYVQILYLEEAVGVYSQLLHQDSIVCQRGEEMLRAGKISRVELTRLQSQMSSGRYDVVNARTQVANYKTQLRQLLELQDEDMTLQPLSTTDEAIIAAIPDKADVYAAALTWRPEMKVSELAIAQSDVAVKSARAGRMPQINLTGGLGDSHITGGRSNFFSQMKTNFNANVGVSVSIPILDNRQNKSAIERAQVQQLTSQLDMADARKALYTTIEDYWLGTTNSQAKYIAAKDNCASAQASYDMVQEQFRLGVKNIADLIDARAELLSANQNMIQDKYTALLNRTMLNFYSNGTITL